jgi:hypothetical protein
MNYFEEIKKELFKFKHLGEETVTETGALLIGRAPHIAAGMVTFNLSSIK